METLKPRCRARKKTYPAVLVWRMDRRSKMDSRTREMLPSCWRCSQFCAVAPDGSLLVKSCYNLTRRLYLSRSMSNQHTILNTLYLSDSASGTVLYEIFISETRTEKSNKVRMLQISPRKTGSVKWRRRRSVIHSILCHKQFC